MVVIVTKTITNCSEIFSLASCYPYSYLRGSSLLSDKLLMPYIMLGLLCLVFLWFIGPLSLHSHLLSTPLTLPTHTFCGGPKM